MIFPTGVSFTGAAERSTYIRVHSTFPALSATVADAPNTGGAIRIGAPSTYCFGVQLENFTLELADVTSVGSIGIGSSTLNDCGLRNVTVTNFVSRGVQIIGGSYGGDGYLFDNVQCYKWNGGSSGGIGFDLQEGTYPCTVRIGQVIGGVGFPLAAAYSVTNMTASFISCNCDGSGSIAATDGILVVSSPSTTITNFVCNGATNAIHITSSGAIHSSGLWAPNSTNAIVDSGGVGSIAKTIAGPYVPLYTRAPVSPSVFELVDIYSQARIASNGNLGFRIDTAANIGLGRFQALSEMEQAVR